MNDEIFTEIKKLTVGQGKIILTQGLIAKEVIIQHRLRMDCWTGTKRTKIEQRSFKDSLAAYYERINASHPNKLKCMIMEEYFPFHQVRAAHIWKYSTNGVGLFDFNLKENDVNCERNGLLLAEAIEEAFDVKKVCFLVNPLDPEKIILKVLDPSILLSVVCPGVATKFEDIDGAQLMHPDGKIPYRRILHWHARLSYNAAIKRGWIENSETFTNYFDLSIGGSIPDFSIYQDNVDSII